MAVYLADLIRIESFNLSSLVEADEPVELAWTHNSDLSDPTRFTEPGTLLLTTGRQFTDGAQSAETLRVEATAQPADYIDYVQRLQQAEIAAIGFGTEVFTVGTPPGLIDACAAAGLPLIEVPLATPFIAISRWLADQHAARERARIDWALEAQNSIAVAAIGSARLAEVIARAARILGARIQVFDSRLDLIDAAGQSSTGASQRQLEQAARTLLSAGRRGVRSFESDSSTVLLHTLGQAGALRGVIALERPTGFDSAEMSVLTTMTALAEVSLQHQQDVRMSIRALLVQLHPLLVDGRTDVVRRAISGLPAGLPRARFVVVALDGEITPSQTLDSLERRAADPGAGIYHLRTPTEVLSLVDVASAPAIRHLLVVGRARAGISSVVEWDGLEAATIQARRGLAAADDGEVLDFSTLVSTSTLGLLASPEVHEMARARLAAVTSSDPDRVLRQAAVWLRHQGQWDPAARELGLHRHTLKQRVMRLGRDLGIDLDHFAGRAELWALLSAIGVAD